MEFVLVRHTNTDWDSVGRIKGQTDIPLGNQGRREAEQLGRLLPKDKIGRIVSSDLKRARQTAEIINQFLLVPIGLDNRLRECSFGKIEGLTKQEALEKYGPSIGPTLDDQFHSYDFRLFGGESKSQVLARHLTAIQDLTRTNQDGAILIVGHNRSLATLLAGLNQNPNINEGEYRLIEYHND